MAMDTGYSTILFLEKTFGIKVEHEMVPDNLDSANGIVRYLQRKPDGCA